MSMLPECKAKILSSAIPLFAKEGFNGISMRQLAKEVGLNPSTLYHHFKDKQELYTQAIAYAFSSRSESLSKAIREKVPPESRLKLFLTELCHLVKDDSNFGKLIQREILADDEERLEQISTHVFQDFFAELVALCHELNTEFDSQLLAISVLGLVVYHYQITPIRKFHLGSSPEHNHADIVADHVLNLVLYGIKGFQQPSS